MGPPPDAQPDAFAGPVPVDDCAGACARYQRCGRVDELFGGPDACQAVCEEASFDGPPEAFFECVSVEQCGLLQLCRLPVPPALTCDEVCARANECGVEVPFDCATECARHEDGYAACGERNRRACDPAGFQGCLGEEIYTGCARRCERAVACNIVLEEGCLTECLEEQFAGDALRRRRAEQRTQCVGRAPDDCVAVDACLNPQDNPPRPAANLETFCRLWRECGFELEIPCDAIWDEFAREPDMAQCVVDSLDAQCPRDPFEAFERCFEGGGGPRGPGCIELCEAMDLCEELPDGEDRGGCLQRCNVALQSRDPNDSERQRARFPCGVAGDCVELAECLEATDPATACATHCDALAACGIAAEGCAADCDAEFVRARQVAWRECVAAAADCDATRACAPPAPLPCDVQCQAVAACGFAQPGCEAACDNAHFDDPDRASRVFACVLTAPECRGGRGEHSVALCLNDPGVGGDDCLGFCRATSDACDPEAGRDLATCLAACGNGFGGDDALRFEVAAECMDQRGADADCDELAGCLPGEIAPDCGAWCGSLEACGLADDGCAGACADDVLATLRALRHGTCVADAGDDCEEVRACVAVEIGEEPERPTRDAFCAAYAQCNFIDEEFRCEDLWRELGGNLEAERCAMIEVQRCPRFPFEILDRCIEGGEPPPPAEASACEALCEARALCGDVERARACALDCAGAFRDGDVGDRIRLRATLECAAALSCGALADCLAERSPAGQCARHCGQLAGCGLAPDDCVESCDETFVRGRQRAWLGCTDDAADDCEALAVCEPGPGVPCGDYCARLETCALAPADCETACDDQHFEDPTASAIRVVCALTAPTCEAPPAHNVAACLRGDPLGLPGRECVTYCRAVTECDEGSERTLDDCVNACARGFEGEDGLRFAAASDCLRGLLPDVDCRPLGACMPDEIVIDCAAHCDALEACRAAPDDCPAHCAAEVEVGAAGCVADALRVNRGCRRVAECAGFEVPAPSDACERLCASRRACDFAVDPFLCELDCAPDEDGTPVRAACAEVTPCEDLGACTDGDAPRIDGCGDPCEAAAECGALEDADACVDLCSGRDLSPRSGDDYVAELGGCVEGAADAPACVACFDVGHDCADACFHLQRCGLFEPGGDCVGGCEQASVQDPVGNAEVIECLVDSLDPNCDFNGLERCVEGTNGGEGEGEGEGEGRPEPPPPPVPDGR